MRSLAAATFISLALASSAAAATVEATDLEGVMQTPTAVYCADGVPPQIPDAVGYALIDARQVYLLNDLCAELRGPLRVDRVYAGALLALLHELAHVGWANANESATDCFALFTFRWEARHRFGATVSQANDLYALAWLVHLSEPARYQGCQNFKRDPLP